MDEDMMDIYMGIGDMVVCNYGGYSNVNKGGVYKVLDTRTSSGEFQIKIKNSYSYSPTWYKAKNFTLETEKTERKNGMFLVIEMTTMAQGTVTSDSYITSETQLPMLDTATQYTSEKMAIEAMKTALKESPEKIFGLFPLAKTAKVDAPPIKFSTVWKN